MIIPFFNLVIVILSFTFQLYDFVSLFTICFVNEDTICPFPNTVSDNQN